MGLMICENLVDKNGGTISVHSDGENKGSVFSFTMKMKRYDEDTLQRVIEADEEHSSHDGESSDSVSKGDSDSKDEATIEAVVATSRADQKNIILIENVDQEQTIENNSINFSFQKADEGSSLTEKHKVVKRAESL